MACAEWWFFINSFIDESRSWAATFCKSGTFVTQLACAMAVTDSVRWTSNGHSLIQFEYMPLYFNMHISYKVRWTMVGRRHPTISILPEPNTFITFSSYCRVHVKIYCRSIITSLVVVVVSVRCRHRHRQQRETHFTSIKYLHMRYFLLSFVLYFLLRAKNRSG